MISLFKQYYRQVNRPLYWVWSLFGGIVLVRFWPFLFNQTLFFGDNYSLMVPGKMFTAWWLRQGVLPLWNPFIFSGIEWISEINQSVLYPTTGLFVFFQPATALNVTIVSQVILTGLGCWLLTRRLKLSPPAQFLAMGLWTFSTQVTGSINNLSTIQSITWVPWLVWLGMLVPRFRWARLVFGVIALIHFWAGYPQHVVYGILAAVVWSLFVAFEDGLPVWRLPLRGSGSKLSWFGAWLETAVWSVSLSAMAWLPFVMAFFESTRVIQTAQQAQVGSLHPVMLLKTLLPHIFDQPQVGMKWGPAWSGQPNVVWYLTWIGTFLGLANLFFKKLRRPGDSWFWFGTAGLVIFSLGSYLPGYEQLQEIIPLLTFGRYPSMVLIWVTLLLAFWVPIQLDRLEWRLPVGWFRWGFGGLLIIALASVVGYWLVSWHFAGVWQLADSVLGGKLTASGFHTLARDEVIALVLVSNVLSASLFGLAAWVALKQQRAWLVAILLVLDVVWHTQSMLFFADRSIYPTWPEVAEQQGQILPGFEVAPDQRILTRNSNLPYTDFGTYWEALVVRRPFSDSFIDDQEMQDRTHLKALRFGQTPDWNLVSNIPMVHGYTALLPQDYSQLWPANHDLVPVGIDPNQPRINFIHGVDPADPLLDDWAVGYYLVDTWFQIEESLDEWPIVAEFDRWQLRQRSTTLSRFRFGNDQPAELLSYSEHPHSLELTINNDQDQSWLIVADRYDPDWQATINGQSVQIESWHGQRRIPIQSGQNEIVLTYQPIWFWRGLAITVVSGLIGILTLIYQSKIVLANKD